MPRVKHKREKLTQALGLLGVFRRRHRSHCTAKSSKAEAHYRQFLLVAELALRLREFAALLEELRRDILLGNRELRVRAGRS